MANTHLGQQLTKAFRRAQLALRASALREVLTVWPMFDLDDIDGSWPALESALAAIIDSNHRRAAQQAASYFITYRTVEGAEGRVFPVVAEPPDPTFSRATLALLGPIYTKKAIAAGRSQRAAATALTRVSGTVGRQVLKGGRDTLQQSIQSDPDAQGWQRITDGSPCDFCASLAGHGIVGPNAGFQAHDHCGCTAEPVYRMRPGGSPDQFRAFLADFETQVEVISAAGTARGIAEQTRGGFYTAPPRRRT